MKSPAKRPARTVSVRAPARIDLGGGWTDVPPYCDERGGFVCNLAITRYAVATVHAAETYRVTGDVASSRAGEETPLIAAAVRRSGMTDVDVMVESDFPVGAGLGGSSSASAAVLTALARWRGEDTVAADIAEEGRRIEVEDLGVAGGRQDHYAATHGGALALTFTDRVSVRRLRIAPATRAAFESRALLVYTGESRISGSTITAVLDAYRAGEPRVLNALATMKLLAGHMAEALESGNIDTLGALLAEHWIHQRSLHPAIATERIDRIVALARDAGAAGWKAMGASGGGCVLVLAGARNVAQVRREIASLGEVLDFRLDFHGPTEVPEQAR